MRRERLNVKEMDDFFFQQESKIALNFVKYNPAGPCITPIILI